MIVLGTMWLIQTLQTVISNTWSQGAVIGLTCLVAWFAKGPVVHALKVFFSYFFNQKKLTRENVKLREELKEEKQKNEEWEGIIADIERRYSAIREELDRTKFDLCRLKDLQEAKTKRIEELEIDRNLLLHWGRALVGQMMAYEITPQQTEPELLTLELPGKEKVQELKKEH